MSLRASEVRVLVDELRPKLVDGRIQDVRVPLPTAVIVSVRRPGETIHLRIEAGGEAAAVHTVARPPPNPARAHALQGLLRRDLRGTIESVDVLAGGREIVVSLHGEPRKQLRWVGGVRGAIELLIDGHRAGGSGIPEGGAPDGSPRFISPMDDAVGHHYSSLRAELAHHTLRRRVRKTLRSRLKAAERLVRKRTAEAARGSDAERLRTEGELLQGHFHQLERGMTEIVVSDWYDDGAPRTLELDRTLAAAEQVAARFRRAKRARRAAKQAGDRIPEARERARRLGQLLAELDAVETDAEIHAFVERLPPNLRPSQQTSAKQRGAERARPWRTYRTAAGIEILAGRGARQNDELTHRHAKGNDVWLHVRERPGAHVVIRNPGPAPALELLLAAAQVAAAHSNVPEGDTVDVAWTRVKHLRRSKGMPPGAVLVTQEKVLHVRASRVTLGTLHREDP